MRFSRRAQHLLVLMFLSVAAMAMIASFVPHLHGNLNRSVTTQNSMTSWIHKRAYPDNVRRYVKSWMNNTFTGGEETNEDKTINQVVPDLSYSSVLPPLVENGSILIDRRVAEAVSKKVRVLCWIPTREMYRETRLKAVNTTWARRCDKVIYFITSPKILTSDTIKTPINDSRKTLTDKTVFAHKYLYRHYLHDFDWFLKADDDTYVIMENLKFLLSSFLDRQVAGYIGCQFKHFAPQGYMSGGASYAFNAAGLKKLVEDGYRIPGRCRLTGGAEDIETGRCAYKAGIRTLDQLDRSWKQTFFPQNVYAFAQGPIPHWAVSYSRTKTSAGLDCCSPLPVSFHYTGAKLMMAMEFLLYRVVVHGRKEIMPKAEALFAGNDAPAIAKEEKRRAYPGEKLEDYYKHGWRNLNTTIYIRPGS